MCPGDAGVPKEEENTQQSPGHERVTSPRNEAIHHRHPLVKIKINIKKNY